MADKQKFDEQELAKLKALQDRFNNIILQFGQIDIELIKNITEKTRLEQLKEKLQNDYITLRTEEQALAADLTKKYGTGILNPTTGEFTPQETK